jgi:disulfide bond formation protein DsbB
MSVPETPGSPAPAQEPSLWLWGATLVALAALAGSLYLSIGMGLKACPLCYYQRTFIMGVVAILVAGLFIRDVRPSALTVLALPLAWGGLFVAGWHEYLEQTGRLECPAGVLQVGTAPQQSLAALGLLVLLLSADQLRQRRAAAWLGTLTLGALLAFAGIRSTSSAVPNYTLPVDDDMCRQPKPPS